MPRIQNSGKKNGGCSPSMILSGELLSPGLFREEAGWRCRI